MPDNDKLLADVHAAVKAYCDANHDFSFDPNDPVVRLHEPTFSTDEIMAGLEPMLTTHVTMGPKVKQFERDYADAFGWKHGVMVNSGSSANLLAIAALANKETENALQPGDEVIVPALSWSTTVWPLIQLGLVPVVVDVDPKTLNIDPNEVEKAIGPKTRAVMIVPVYGNPCDMDAIVDICKRKNLTLIEDCCESMGATYDGTPVGRFGRVATFSTYFSHHISTMEGGLCLTDDFGLAENMRILRAHGWVRETENPDVWYDRYPEISPRFLFVNLGYNLRATETQGAMGSVQLPKLDGFIESRRASANAYRAALDEFSDVFDFQVETPKGKHTWFGFPMTVKPNAPFKVTDIMAALKAKNIETRPIICGNIARQPAMALYEHRVSGDLKNASMIMDTAFSFGNHQAVDDAARAYVVDAVADFVRNGT